MKQKQKKYKWKHYKKQKIENARFIVRYDKKVTRIRDIEGNKDITRIEHQNESERINA